ncbi:efflux RND transporter periplasmic adaptor subunit [Pedobacter nanyangensis]|uniref:efflux RND transporter periplasmic adaptor subunit n=1 Tax=Pedobacter nanyangensis TaxID=1562389 RepID=UPI000DE24214|nr:efflux RND transporter periplasmic adaptor subunit [Pedobacter nanyangensis]
MKRNLMLTGLCTILLYYSCTQKKEEKEEETHYTATSPLTLDTSFTKEYVSQIRSVRNIEIRAQEKGFLQNIYVDEGQKVKAGQLLFKIMPKMYEAEVMKAEAEVKASEIELQNTQLLADKNVVAKNELAMAKAKLEQAKASKALAKLHLSFTEIRAPFDGTIDRLPKKLGSLIDEGELLTTLSDNSQMFAYFNVSEPEYLNFQQAKSSHNKSVSLVLANGETLTGKGSVETIEGEFDSETGNIAFRAKFPNPNQLLRNGETGKVQMVIPLKNALIIPQKATYELQDKIFVFVIDKNGVAKSKEIKIGGELPDIYVVASGLQQGDKIVLDGVQKVKEDDKIKFNFMAPKEVLNQLQLKAE